MEWKLLGSGNEEVKIRDQFIKVMRKILKKTWAQRQYLRLYLKALSLSEQYFILLLTHPQPELSNDHDLTVGYRDWNLLSQPNPTLAPQAMQAKTRGEIWTTNWVTSLIS